MAITIYYLLVLIAGSNVGRALSLPNQDCVTKVHNDAWSALKKIAINEVDNRYGMTEGAPVVGLSPKEAAWLRQVTGTVACRGKDGKFFGGSGTIFEKNDQIITSGHLLIRPDGIASDCFFETKSIPPVRRKIEVASSRTILGTVKEGEDNPLDFALVKLERPILKLDPVKRFKNANAINTNQDILMVSAQQLRMKRAIQPNEPIVQKCKIKNLIPPREGSGTSVYTDCSSTSTASGSMSFVRDESGGLVGIGIQKESARVEFDNQPYSFANGVTARSLVFDGALAAALDR